MTISKQHRLKIIIIINIVFLFIEGNYSVDQNLKKIPCENSYLQTNTSSFLFLYTLSNTTELKKFCL